jgi:hypothetical protein
MEDLMPDERPIACSLSATELRARQAQMAELGRDALVAARVAGTHAELRFARVAGVLERVQSVVAAESQCCAFLTMRVDDAPDDVRLTIDAPTDAEPVLAELVDVFRGESQAV